MRTQAPQPTRKRAREEAAPEPPAGVDDDVAALETDGWAVVDEPNLLEDDEDEDADDADDDDADEGAGSEEDADDDDADEGAGSEEDTDDDDDDEGAGSEEDASADSEENASADSDEDEDSDGDEDARDEFGSDDEDGQESLEEDGSASRSTELPLANDVDMSAWGRFALHESLMKGLQALRFATPTPIQAAALPAALFARRYDNLATALAFPLPSG